MSDYCICKRGSSQRNRALAWTFSAFVAVVCVACPIISFAADVTFYVICTDHYGQTERLLHRVRFTYAVCQRSVKHRSWATHVYL